MAQPTEVEKDKPVEPVGAPLTMQDLGALLIKHYDLHEGKFDLIVEFQIGIGNFGPSTPPSPGAVVSVSRVSLAPSTEVGPQTFDAAKINPAPKPKRK